MDELAPNLEMMVLRTIQGAFKSREVLEAEWPEDAPQLDDDRVFLHNWSTMVDRQGTLLAQLAVVPSTRAELMDRMPGMVNSSPAYLGARVNAEPMTWRLFFTGLAQTAATHREAIERVMAEQTAESEKAEEMLAAAPIPAANPDEDLDELMAAVFNVLLAHTKALVDIAYDLEMQLRAGADDEDVVVAPDQETREYIEEFGFHPNQKFKIAEGVDMEDLLEKLDELREDEVRRELEDEE